MICTELIEKIKKANKTCFEGADTRAKIVVKENGKCFILENNSKKLALKIKLDAGNNRKDELSALLPIDHTLQKCDYLIIICDNPETIYFVELKGHHISQAFNQLLHSIQYFINKNDWFQIDNKKHNVKVRIVSNQVPRTHDKLEVDFKNNLKNLKITIQNNTIKVSSQNELKESI